MKLTIAQIQAFEERLICYLNTNDFFWSSDIRLKLNIVYSNASINPYENLMNRRLAILKKKALIGVSDSKGSNKGMNHQYYHITDKKLVIKDIK